MLLATYNVQEPRPGSLTSSGSGGIFTARSAARLTEQFKRKTMRMLELECCMTMQLEQRYEMTEPGEKLTSKHTVSQKTGLGEG